MEFYANKKLPNGIFFGNTSMISNRELLSNIELIIFDFDGVFTDNAVYVTQDGAESVRCWRSDGLGLEKLKKIGVKLHILSSEVNPVVSMRSAKLNIGCSQGVEDKAEAVLELCHNYLVNPQRTMFVGNDTNDIAAFQSVGIAVGVADSHEDINSHVMFKTEKKGGMGAVREICDIVLRAKIE